MAFPEPMTIAPIARSARMPIVLILVASGGCGSGAPPCEPPDPACAVLSDETIYGLTTWIGPSDWAVTRADRPGTRVADGDVLELGGAADATIHLRFDDLPSRLHVRRAVLELRPEEGWSGPSRAGRVVVHRTMPFRGRDLTRRRAPAAMGTPVGDLDVGAGGPRALLVDVTTAVDEAQRTGRTTIHLRLRRVDSEDGTSWRWASPRATDPRRRPRLVLVAR